ncbi:MAG: nucleotidyltransferase family protein, partial [Candidatus Acidiferrales bacterium]
MQEPAGDIKPEIEILLCCARGALSPVDLARLERISQSPIDWPLLFQLATENGLLPLLCEHLLQNSAIVPSETIMQFRDANRQNALRALFLTAELLRITESLCRRQIPALPYKGPVLGQLAYANPSLRQFDDLDIVVPQRFMPQVYEEMETLGYEAKFSRDRFLAAGRKDIPGEYVFLHKING